MTPTVLQRFVSTPWSGIEERPTEETLRAMGFDVNRLGFYAWLVTHGKEPLDRAALQFSDSKYCEAG